jgi:type II secretory pathway pseudopilin PulG
MIRNSTSGYRLSEKLARRLLPNGDERGVAMLMAIAFMIVVAGLSTVIVSTILGQVAPTALEQKQTQTVYAAQAGMQAALGRFRAAVLTNSSGVVQTDTLGNALGDPTKLPCSLSGTLSPTTPADGQAYSVVITYFDADPTYESTTWQTDTSVPNSDRLACNSTLPSGQPGAGVTSTAAHPVKFALLTSTGIGKPLPRTSSTSTVGNRSVTAVYQFKVSTVNIVGGLINDYDDGGAFCLSAVRAQAGSSIQFLPATQCTTANKALQLWVYDVDYELKLASSIANGLPGLCITGPVHASDTLNQSALLEPCISGSVTRWNQLWDWYGSNTWAGTNSTITPTGTPPNTTTDSGWNLGTGYAAGTDLSYKPLLVMKSGTIGGFSPTTAVGAGAAGYNTNEMVNYLEFGRCADDTGENPGATHMITYPCKQDPAADANAGIKWNQKFYYTEPPAQLAGLDDQYPARPVPLTGTQARQQITVIDTVAPTTKYCLTWASSATKPTAGALVVLKACPTTTTYQNWVRVYNTGDYSTSYTFTTPGLTTGGAATTLCLEVNPSVVDSSGGWSEMDLAVCSGSLAQKWNAPAAYVASELGGYKEIGG